MYHLNPLLAIDFYKTDHRRQYPVGTTKVYSNLTARHGKRVPVDELRVVFKDGYYFNRGSLQGIRTHLKDQNLRGLGK